MRPQGVEVVRRGGSRIPCELAPAGIGEDGIEYWSVATELEVGDELHIGFMPAMTSIMVPVADDVEARRVQ